MKIWYSPYELMPQSAVNRASEGSRRGFLIKLQTDHFQAGYADCHPWTLFGDDTVDVQIEKLRQKVLTPLLERSLYFAALDGEARAKEKALLKKSLLVKNHFTCVNFLDLTEDLLLDLEARAFTTIKVKVGRDIDSEIIQVNSLNENLWTRFRWRFDCNGRGGQTFLKALDPFRRRNVDFMEDPEAYQIEVWEALTRDFHVPLALDQAEGAPGDYAGPRILKPARQSELARAQDVVTSSMDHPVGQSFAFWQAQQGLETLGKQSTDYGLLTQHLYTENSYARAIHAPACYFVPGDGWGIGFDDLLEREEWLAL